MGIETMELLIYTLIPPDESLQEDEFQQEVSTDTTPRSQNIEPPITTAELELATKNTKPRKAAGSDRIPLKILLNLDQCKRQDLLMLLENEIMFPEAWKAAKIKIIRKDGNRYWALGKSWILQTN